MAQVPLLSEPDVLHAGVQSASRIFAFSESIVKAFAFSQFHLWIMSAGILVGGPPPTGVVVGECVFGRLRILNSCVKETCHGRREAQ